MESALLNHIDTLTQIAVRIRGILDIGTTDRQLRALKALPEVVDALLEARAKYRAFTGVEAPGVETLEALRAFSIQSGGIPHS